MTRHDVAWEEASRTDARRVEDEVVAAPDAACPSGMDAIVSQPNRPDRRGRLFTVRLSDDEYTALQELAATRHLPASTMARAWLLDRLTDERRAS